jgi:hypothetical protein
LIFADHASTWFSAFQCLLFNITKQKSKTMKQHAGEYLSFQLGGEQYGIDILKVQEISVASMTVGLYPGLIGAVVVMTIPIALNVQIAAKKEDQQLQLQWILMFQTALCSAF